MSKIQPNPLEKNYNLKLKINEIFCSIQGESTLAGLPTIFIRTTGCPLRCSYCDTSYAYENGSELSFAEIFESIHRFYPQHICLTGGEPLSQKNCFLLAQSLCDMNYRVSIETNGAIDCSPLDPRVKIVLDVKTPDSQMSQHFDFANLKLSHPDIEFKFVICSKQDFEWSENFIRQHKLTEKSILYSPSWGKVSEKWLSEKILEKKSNTRLQLQLHKYIWNPNVRGK